jgi:hypothetical protein
LYENPTDRARVKKIKRWNPVLKEITQLRQRYLKDLIENSDWVKKQREKDPKWGSILEMEYSEELDCKELKKITVKLKQGVRNGRYRCKFRFRKNYC